MRPASLKKLTAQGGELAEQLCAIERERASRRAKVEHVFCDLKVRFGYAKVRYRGLAKNLSRFISLATLSMCYAQRFIYAARTSCELKKGEALKIGLRSAYNGLNAEN